MIEEEERNKRKIVRLDWKEFEINDRPREKIIMKMEYTDLESENIIGGNKRVDIG